MISARTLNCALARGCCWTSASFQVAAGDKIGLVGRNGAGKTTLARVLAGEGQPAAGQVVTGGSVGYLPQDTMVGDLEALALDRILSARGLDALLAGLREAELQMADPNPARRDAGVRRYGHLEERLTVLGGYAAESEAASLAASLGLPQKVLKQPLRTLSGGQRRRIELARILFGGSRHAAARRADQPPGRRLRRLAARSPADIPRRPGRHQPRHRPAGRGRQQGLPPRRRPQRAWTSTTSAGRPTSSSARPTHGGVAASG